MVTTVNGNSPKEINTSLFSIQKQIDALNKQAQELQKQLDTAKKALSVGGLINDEVTGDSTTWSSEKIADEIDTISSATGGYFNLKGGPTVTIPTSGSSYASFIASGVSQGYGEWLCYGGIHSSTLTTTFLVGSSSYVTVAYSSTNGITFTDPNSSYALRVRGIYCPHP